MRVAALVGSSGTGKSYRASELANQLGIEYIVDDGLLICGSKKIAGRSAKREKTKVGAVKRALFSDPEHRHQVQSALEERQPESILILGTSDEMVNRIAQNLKLGVVAETYTIQQLASEQEIAAAREQRMRFGKHIIPVPAVELKQDFSGYFLDRLSVLLGRRGAPQRVAEKTVVRPTFSYLGSYTVSNRALGQIITYVSKNIPGIQKVQKISVKKYDGGIELYLEISTKYKYSVLDVCKRLQEDSKKHIEDMTNINVACINIHAKTIS